MAQTAPLVLAPHDSALLAMKRDAVQAPTPRHAPKLFVLVVSKDTTSGGQLGVCGMEKPGPYRYSMGVSPGSHGRPMGRGGG